MIYRIMTVQFLIDEFHSAGHRCPKRYHIKHNRDDLDYGLIATQVAEVANRTLKYIKISTRYMSHQRAFSYLCHFVSLKNELKMQKYMKPSYQMIVNLSSLSIVYSYLLSLYPLCLLFTLILSVYRLLRSNETFVNKS